MNYGRLFYKRHIKFGFGLLSAEKPDKWLHELLETEVRRPVVSCGMLFQKAIALDIVTLISGVHIKLLSQKSNIQR